MEGRREWGHRYGPWRSRDPCRLRPCVVEAYRMAVRRGPLIDRHTKDAERLRRGERYFKGAHDASMNRSHERRWVIVTLDGRYVTLGFAGISKSLDPVERDLAKGKVDCSLQGPPMKSRLGQKRRYVGVRRRQSGPLGKSVGRLKSGAPALLQADSCGPHWPTTCGSSSPAWTVLALPRDFQCA